MDGTLNKRKIIFIILMSFAVQLIYLHINPLFYPRMDAATYDVIGLNIATGKGFSIDGIKPTTLYPLYPIFLSLIYKIFGHNYFIVQMFLSFFISLTCAIIYLLGKLVFNEKTGLLSAIFIALYPPLFGLSRIMYTEPLFIMLLYLSIFLYCIISRNKYKLTLILLSGILLGAAILTKPSVFFLPFIILITILFSFPFKKASKLILMFSLGILILMLPWIIRNYIVFGDFRPVSSFAFKSGKIIKVDLAASYDREELLRGLNLHQQSLIKDYYRKVNPQPQSRPEDTALEKLVFWFGSDDTGNPRNFIDLIRRMYITSYSDIIGFGLPFRIFLYDKDIMYRYLWMFLVKTIVILISFIIFLFGIIGMISSLRKSKETALLISIFFSYTVFFYLWVTFMMQAGITGRYGLPVIGILVLFATDQIIRSMDKIKSILNLKKE